MKAQDLQPDENNALMNLKLKCIEGGVFSSQEVIIKNVGTGSVIKAVSGADGKALADLYELIRRF